MLLWRVYTRVRKRGGGAIFSIFFSLRYGMTCRRIPGIAGTRGSHLGGIGFNDRNMSWRNSRAISFLATLWRSGVLKSGDLEIQKKKWMKSSSFYLKICMF